ncbi:MAG TPA: FMN-binding protein [Spirochaetia bacterium]|nr:FMN-binding protein [Spirochaetia bacterium]
MKTNTKKAVVSMVLVAGLGIGTASYLMRPAQNAMQLLSNKKSTSVPASGSSVAAGTAPPQTNTRRNTISAALATAAKKSGNQAAIASAKSANYNLSDGNYTGGREYAFYGYVRVEAVVQNGQLQDVRVLEHPNDNGTSRYINSIAMPYLVQEAVQANSASVSLISGATLSSEAFVKSLDSALRQAGA